MNDRFIRLSVSLSRLQKVIQRIKTDGMNRIELKAGHTLVLCQLDAAPDGYRFSELTERCDLDPAMISRVRADLARIGQPVDSVILAGCAALLDQTAADQIGQHAGDHCRVKIAPLGQL